ncbi:MAG: carbamoyl-phosphate synthase domain-containing protein [Armatimonadota bacterium]|nr:hypothetical protein [bacterium]
MKPVFLTLEDGTVFEGMSVNEKIDTVGFLSFYTGVVGYQEVITDPANLGKIVLFTYPLIGNYGVNAEDSESTSVKVRGIVTKEYPSYYSNFRATGSLADYMSDSSAVFGTGFDTRAVLLYMREHGEMMAAMSEEPLKQEDVLDRIQKAGSCEYSPENSPIACAQAHPRVNALVIDLGASRSFYEYLSALGVDACCVSDQADVVIVSDAPHYAVEQQSIIDRVKAAASSKPILGFGHGSAIVAQACGGTVKRVSFGDHGVNIPVAYSGGGRNEITVQNHIYEVVAGDVIESIFTNLHDGSCEGFKSLSKSAAGANFLPPTDWFDAMLKSVGVG